MSSLSTLARTEARLFLREPGSALMALLLPTVILVALGAVPALREPTDTFGGGSFMDVFTPSLLGWSLAFMALQTLPAVVVGYREKGILRRLAATPMRPAALLGVQLAIYTATAVLGMLVMVGVAVLAFGLPAPRHPLAFAVTFVVGVGAMFAIGLCVAALAPRAKVAAGAGTVALLVTQFFGGLYLPKFLLPDVVNRIGELVPPGIGAFQSAWTGGGWQPVPLATIATIGCVAAAVAVRFFRWE
jgi:ABC-2 type transport system permease protein